MSWFDDNDPSMGGADQGGSAPQQPDQFAQQLTALYAKYGRGAPDAATIEAHRQNPGGLAAIEQQLSKDNIAGGLPGTPQPPTTQQAPAASGGGRTDRNAILAQVAQWAAMPGADPSLANDPNYWADRIIQTGGLGADNSQYWQDASVGANAFFNHPDREQSGSNSLSNIGQTAPQPFQNYQPTPAMPTQAAAPAYNPLPAYTPPPAPVYNPITAPTYTAPAPLAAATPYTLPTAADAKATPGYQFTQDEQMRLLQNSAAAHGGLLNGGTLRDLQTNAGNIADTYYNSRVNQSLGAYNTNETTREGIYGLNANTGLNAFNANTNALLNTNAQNTAGQNQQFQNTYQPSFNAYQASLGQNQFGANYGLSANNQNFNQGLAANNQGFGQNLAMNQFNLGAQGQGFNQGLATNQFNLGAQNQYWNQGFNENQNAYNQYNTSQNSAFNQWLALANLGNPGNPYA